MAEYAGYVATAPVNYGEITKDLVTSFITIDQAKREEDKRTQQELDKNFSSDMEKLTDFALTSNASFNDKISNLGDNTKVALLNAYKTGNMREVNRIKANLKTGINNINAASKVIDTNFGEIKSAIAKGDVSDIGTVYAEMYGDATNFNDGEFFVMPDGKIPYVKYDKDGKIVSKSSFYDPATLASTKPFIDPNVKYDEDLNKWMKSIGSYTDEQGKVTIISPLKNPAFPKAKESKIDELTSTDRNTARFLTSVGGYVGYKSEEQKRGLLSKNKNLTEDKLIKVELINGVPQPILSEVQNKAARKLAEQEIDQRVAFAKTFDEDRSGSAFSGMANFFERENYKAMQRDAREMKPIVTRVKNADKIYRSKDIADWGPLKEAARFRGIKDPSILHNLDGTKTLSGIPKNKRTPVEIVTFKSPEEIYAYTSNNKDVSEATGEYAQGKEFMSTYGVGQQDNRGASPAPQPKPSSSPKETIEIDVNATIQAAKAKGKTVTPAQVKAAAMQKHSGKKLIWK
jgi:hypothetical protein